MKSLAGVFFRFLCDPRLHCGPAFKLDITTFLLFAHRPFGRFSSVLFAVYSGWHTRGVNTPLTAFDLREQAEQSVISFCLSAVYLRGRIDKWY